MTRKSKTSKSQSRWLRLLAKGNVQEPSRFLLSLLRMERLTFQTFWGQWEISRRIANWQALLLTTAAISGGSGGISKIIIPNRPRGGGGGRWKNSTSKALLLDLGNEYVHSPPQLAVQLESPTPAL